VTVNNVTRRRPVFSTQQSGVFNRRRAFQGTVTFLGQTGQLDTEAVIDRTLAHPTTGQFIANKLVDQFVTTSPDSKYVAALGAQFRRAKYDMKTLMRAIFKSPEFTAGANYRSLVKTPIEFMLQTARALDSSSLAKLIITSGSGMGQTLFDPPDVNGWPSNEAWISSNTVVERVNFATAALTQHKGSLPQPIDAVRHQLDGVLGVQTANLFNQAADDRARWFIVLASPEIQLK